MNYKIAIPSYKRPETIKRKTLKIIDEHNINIDRVTIFVADKEEEQEYINSLGSKYKIVVGVPTIGEQRNFIEKYYKEGEKVLMFDDDIDGVFVKDGSKIKGFNECEKTNAKFFGLYAAANGYFMKHRIYNKLCYICGGVFGVIIQHDPFLNRRTNHGEDYEYSIRQYIKNKIVVRFDYITIKSKFFKEEGGLQTIRTKKYIFDSINKIYSMFPSYCTMYIRKSSGNAELRLRDKSL
jgi:hypothetical protein